MARSNAAPKDGGDHRMDFRLRQEHKALIEKAAAYTGETLTGFAVATLVEAAHRVVREHETARLSARDRDRFLALLDEPPAPTAALHRAARRHGELVVRSE